MILKTALSIQQQINLLRQRGMTIDDEEQAFSFLQIIHIYSNNTDRELPSPFKTLHFCVKESAVK